MSINWIDVADLYATVIENIIPSGIVIDVGAGIRPQNFFSPSIHVIIEPYLPYLEIIKSQKDKKKYFYLNNTWENIFDSIPDKSVGSVFAIDVIEHFSKENGEKFLHEATRISTNQVIIFTPIGYYPQDYEISESDRWGLQGGYWQTHRSGWVPEEFTSEWDVFACTNFHKFDQHGNELKESIGAFWAIKNIEPNYVPDENRLLVREMTTTYLLKYTTKRVVNSIMKKLKITAN